MSHRRKKVHARKTEKTGKKKWRDNMNITESFEWMTPEFKILDGGKNTIRIKGIALRSDVISKNKRKYIDEELKKSARTFVEKPVTINHDMNRIVGRIKWMEYDDGALEYLADINKQPYVKMLRDKSAEIKGVSIEANYLHNRCYKCGAQFYTEEDFHHHMATEHFIKTDPTSEPHGIIGQALSLVLSPEEPGYSDTSIELMETYQKPVLQLLETVTKTKIEKENYMKKLDGKVVLTPQARETVDKLKEQTEEPPAHPTDEPEGECKPGFHKNEEGECVADEIPAEPEKVVEKEAGICPPGFHDDGAGGCAADPIPEEPGPTNAPQITPEPEITIPKVDVNAPAIPAPTEQPPLDVTQTLGEQEDNLQPVAHPVEAGGKECPIAGTHYDEASGTCVPDVFTEDPTGAVEPPATKVFTEIKLPKMLTLGEPFANYSDFADCEAKNQDKEDPAAYCASIKQKTEGETAKETSNNIYEQLKTVETRPFIRDVKIAEAVNTQNKAIAEIAKAFPTLARQLQKHQLMESRLRADYDKQTVKFIKENVKVTNTNVNRALKKLSEIFNDSLQKTAKSLSEQGTANLEKSNKDIVEQVNKALSDVTETFNKQFAFAITKVNQLATANAKLTGTVAQQKKDYEKILDGVTAKFKEVKAEKKTLEERLKEQEDELAKHDCGENEHYDKEQDKCVPNEPKQTEETDKKLTEMATRVENLEAKLKGQFKGNAKPLTEHSESSIVADPLKTKKKGRTKNA